MLLFQNQRLDEAMKKSERCFRKKRKVCCLLLLVLALFLYVMNGTYELLLPIWLLLFSLVCGRLLCTAGGRKLSFFPENQTTQKIRIKNASLIPVFRGELLLAWKNALTGEQGRHRLPFAALPYGTTELELLLPTRYCGAYQICAERFEIYDIFSIFRSKRRVKLEMEFLIYPKTGELPFSLPERDVYHMESFRYSDKKSGEDANETFSIREYRKGDKIRNIHWKLTGKMDQVMVREPGYPVFHSILLLWETGYQEAAVPSAVQLDAAMSVYLSTAEYLLGQQKAFEIGYLDHEKQVFRLERIEQAEELWNLVPELLRAGRAVSPQSVYEQYQLWYGDQRYAHYIYVTAEDGYETAGGCIHLDAESFYLEREEQERVEVFGSFYETAEKSLLTVLQIKK